MKRFAFRFQRVLDTRRYTEDMTKNELAALLGQRLEDERQLLAVQDELLDQQQALAGRAEDHAVLVDLALTARYFEKLLGDALRAQERLAQWDRQIEAKREELVEAKRETKVLEQIETADKRRYVKAVGRWEQKLIDEVATGRYVRRAHQEVTR